jgi:hypothetical protein
MKIESLQAAAYADAKAALRACAAAAEQVYAAVARLEEAQRALRRANQALAEVNRLQDCRDADTAQDGAPLRLGSSR